MPNREHHKKRAWLFDLDDTLIKTLQTKTRAIQYTGEKYYGVKIPSVRIRSLWGAPFPKLMSMLFPSDANLDEVIAHYTAERSRFPSPAYPNTVRTLKKLSMHDDVGIVTSHTRVYIRSDLESARIPESLFFHIQTYEDTEFHKPDPRVFDPAIEACIARGIQRENIRYVGDSLIDHEASVGAGIEFIGIYGHTAPKETFDHLGIRAIGDIKELETI